MSEFNSATRCLGGLVSLVAAPPAIDRVSLLFASTKARAQEPAPTITHHKRIQLLFAPLLLVMLATQSLVAYAGTSFAYPPPGTLTFTTGPSTGDTSPPGETWNFSNVQVADWTSTWWGPQIDQIFEFTTAPFVYQGFTQNSATTATAYYFIDQAGAAAGYQQRFTMQYNSQPAGCPNLPLVMATTASAGISDADNTIGVVAQISPGQCLTVQFVFEVCNATSCPPTDPTGTEWVGAIDAFAAWSAINNAGGPNLFPTSFTGGFYYIDSAPTVSSITNQSLSIVGNPPQPMTVGPLDFTVSNLGDPNDVVLGNATSSVSTVVDPTTIVFTNTNGAATITFMAQPQAPNTSATTLISFAGTDGLGSTPQSFNVTVNGDTAPTIGNVSPTSLVVQETATSLPVTFVVGDAETPPNQLIVTAATTDPNSAIASVNLTPPDVNGNASATVTSTGNSGTATITLSVSDGQLMANAPFTVRVNAPPVLNANNGLQVGQGGTTTITTAMLSGTDPDTSSPVTFVIGSVDNQTYNGTLFLNDGASPASFLQTDIDSGNVTYTNGGSCNTSDSFEFEVEDVDGGFANDPTQGSGPTLYSFPITIALTQTAPMAQPGSLQVALGGSASSMLVATSTDCGPPAITYQIATNPAHGQINGLNAATGAFTYTANQGYSGSDSFTFTGTTYGNMVSAPASVSIAIQAAAPVAQAGSLTTHDNDSATGILVATDPNVPALPLTYAIATLPTKGTVAITNATTGAYSYQPSSNLIGADSFTFTASDGTLTSAPATISVQIRPYLKAGDVLITDQGGGGNPTSVIFFDPVSGQQATFSESSLFNSLQGIAIRSSDGEVFVTDSSHGVGSVFMINPVTGDATSFTSVTLQNPFNLAAEADGDILVADIMLGSIVRLDGTTGAQVGYAISLGAKTAPSNVAVATDGVLWVTDIGGAFAGATDNKLWTVNADGSNPQIVTHGGDLNLPTGLTLGSVGDAYVSTLGPLLGAGNPSYVIHVDAQGNQTEVTQDDLLDGATGVALTDAGQLYVTSYVSGRAIVDVDPVSTPPTQTSLTAGGLLFSPFSIAIAPALPGVDLSVTISNASGYLKGGKTTTYIVTVQNNGNQTATGAAILDTLPSNLSAESWICQPTGGAQCTASASGRLIDSLNVPVGATATYTVTATVAKLPETPSAYSVTLLPPSGVTDVDPSNNTATLNLMVKIFANGFN